MANRHKKRCSTLLIIKEMQIKTTMKYTLHRSEWLSSKWTEITSVGKDVGREKGTLKHCWWDCKSVQPLWKTLCRFLRKLKVGLSYDPEILFLRYTKNVGERESHSVMSDSLQPQGLCSLWNSPGQNTGVGILSLLQGIFPTQGLNPGLPHSRQILYQLSHNGSPRILEWVAYPFSRGSS